MQFARRNFMERLLVHFNDFDAALI